tara:strand:- start:632 stop:970 length:339 start_codon:yes stop_codon:yes gene_type:complete
MKTISKKQSQVKRKLNKIYKEIANERGAYCTGCGSSIYPLSHSHIIPRSRRPDLVTDKRNITYHCMDTIDRKGCHNIWESRERYKLLDYHKNLEYIKEIDTEYYYIITELNV